MYLKYKKGIILIDIRYDYLLTSIFVQTIGFVKNNRVNGILSMSRAVGNCKISKFLSPIPDIYEGYLRNFEFIVQSSDGLLDVMKNEEICGIIRYLLRNRVNPKKILSYIIHYGK